MKKNILFIIPSLTAGGGEKSLVSLLSQLDYNLYNVDLFLLNHEGLFMEFLPNEVNVLSVPKTYKWFTMPIVESITKLLLNGKFSLVVNRLVFTLKNKIFHDLSGSMQEQYNWKYIRNSFEKLNKQYDAAIGFLEKTSTYFCVDMVDADKKIGWVHIDYNKLGMDPNFDLYYFDKLDHIVTVSEECANVLRNLFPNQQHKVEVIYNIVSPTVINRMASTIDRDVYEIKGDEIKILSIGRLHYQKGFEMAIESCKELIQKGYNIKWSIIGDGQERENLTNLIEKYKLQNNFRILGLRANPYPYIKQTDIYVQTSRFEGKSIAIDEAKILNKPIVVTNFSTVHDQITNGVDGLIVEMDAISIADGIEKLILHPSLNRRLIDNLSKQNLGTEEEIYKINRLIG